MRIADLFVDVVPQLDIGGLKSQLNTASKQSVSVKAVVDDSQVKALTKNLARASTSTVRVDADTSKAESGLRSLESKLSGLGDKVVTSLSDGLDKAKGFAASSGDDIGGGLMEGIGGAVSALGSKAGPIGLALTAAAGLGVGVGGMIIGQVFRGMEDNSSKYNFAAALGLDERTAGKFAAAAGEAYANNFGESINANMDAARAAVQSGLLNPRDTQRNIQEVVSQLSQVSDTLGFDIPEAAKAAGQMLKTGMAKNAEQAFDVIVKGAQLGLDVNGDLLDTFNEYGTQFRKLGLDGGEALSLINDLVKAGARDTDLAADALKEFSIRAVDGSDQTQQAFEKLNLNAQQMTEQFAKGGPAAQRSFGQVVAAIQKVRDPAERAKIQVALFGTQAEDLGAALNHLDPSNIIKTAGATDRLINTISKDPAAQMEQAKRAISTSFTQIRGAFAQSLAPVFKELSSYITTHRGDIAQFFKTAGDAILQFSEVSLRGLSSFLPVLADLYGGFTDTELKILEFAKTTANALLSVMKYTNPAMYFGLKKVLPDFDSLIEHAKAGRDGVVKMMDATAKGAGIAADGVAKMRGEFDKAADKIVSDARFSDATSKLATGFTNLFKIVKNGRFDVNDLAGAERTLNDTHSKAHDALVAVRNAFREQTNAAIKSGATGRELNGIMQDYQGQLTKVFQKMGLNKKQAQELADKYDGIPNEIMTRAEFEKTKAQNDARSYKDYVNGQLRGITDRTVQIAVSAHAAAVRANYDVMNHATGGYISGPGGPMSDMIPAMLSNGEYVVRASSVNQYGTGLLDMINAGRFAVGGFVRKFATGGAVTDPQVTTAQTNGSRFHAGLAMAQIVQIGRVLGASIAKTLQPATSGIPRANGLYRPVRGGRLSQGLHDEWTGYPAVDIAVPSGTPVYAGASGRVDVSQDLATSYGHWIRLQSQGFSTLYAHLTKRLVGVGATVRGGQLIGYSGSTGNSTGPHLHFGARGRSPYSFLAGGGRAGANKKPSGNRKIVGLATIHDIANGLKDALDKSNLYDIILRLGRRNLSGKQERSFVDALKRTRLGGLQERLQGVRDRLAAATTRRDALVAQRDDFRSSFGGYGPSLSSAVSFRGGIAGGFRLQLSQVKTLAANVRKLKALNYPLGLINQVVGSGSIADAIVASNLLINASPADRASIASSFNEIASLTTTGANKLSDELYGSGIKAANGVIDGLKEKQKDLAKAFHDAAVDAAKLLAKTLHISLHPNQGRTAGGGGTTGTKGGTGTTTGGTKGGPHIGTGNGGGGGGGGQLKTPQDVARAALQSWGWGGQWSALNNIVMRESGWRLKAENPTSTASGLFQLVDANARTFMGIGHASNGSAQLQVAGGLKYIKSRYGTPNNAWAFWQKHHYYDAGGWLQRGATLAQNNTGRPEAVLTAGQWSQMERLIKVLEGSARGSVSSAPLIGHATIRETVDLERYERQRAFRDRRVRI